MYTDGSYGGDESSATKTSSSWSVVVADAHFDIHSAGVPNHESDIRSYHVRGFALIGSAITCTQGVYPAELQAIARALAMLPLSFNVHIHSDSQSSIRAIASYRGMCNERQRMRMSARPLLQLIHHLWSARTAAGGVTEMSHVAAHTDGVDRSSIGNRLADYQANLSRARGVISSTPLTLAQLPLDKLEHHLHLTGNIDTGGMQVINDVRSAANAQLRRLALQHWQRKPSQGIFACDGMLALGRVVMADGTPMQQATLVRVITP